MIVNRQKQYALNLLGLRVYIRCLKRRLQLKRCEFNVCFVNDDEIRRLNEVFRGKPHATDVLSFPWQDTPTPSSKPRQAGLRGFSRGLDTRLLHKKSGRRGTRRPLVSNDKPRCTVPMRAEARTVWPYGRGAVPGADGNRELDFKDFLGEVVISVETARKNARAEGHPTINEIRWLILHGVLHLLGYDHERDGGEMRHLELSLREQLGIGGADRAAMPG